MASVIVRCASILKTKGQPKGKDSSGKLQTVDTRELRALSQGDDTAVESKSDDVNIRSIMRSKRKEDKLRRKKRKKDETDEDQWRRRRF